MEMPDSPIVTIGQLVGAATDAWSAYQSIEDGAEFMPNSGFPEAAYQSLGTALAVGGAVAEYFQSRPLIGATNATAPWIAAMSLAGAYHKLQQARESGDEQRIASVSF
jgi:hypothetical protein